MKSHLDNSSMLHQWTIAGITMFGLLIAGISYALLLLHEAEKGRIEYPLGLLGGVLLILVTAAMSVIPRFIKRFTGSAERALAARMEKQLASLQILMDMGVIVKKMVQFIHSLYGLSGCSFVRYKSAEKELRIIASVGPPLDTAALCADGLFMEWLDARPVFVSAAALKMKALLSDADRKHLGEICALFKIEALIPVVVNGRTDGFFCLHRKRSGRFTAAELRSLALLHQRLNQLIADISVSRERKKTEAVNRMLEFSSDILSRSAPAFLPDSGSFEFGGVTVSRHLETSMYFDFLRPANGGIGATIVDISAPPMERALATVAFRSAFHAMISHAGNPGNLLLRMRDVVCHNAVFSNIPICQVYFFFPETGLQIRYANLGFRHCEIYHGGTDQFETLQEEGSTLGLADASSIANREIDMESGDIGIIFSDALISTKNPAGEVFGLNRVRSIIKGNRKNSSVEIARVLNISFGSFLESAIPDADIVVLVFKATATALPAQ